MRNPGTLAVMEDGRHVIILNNQPLIKQGKVVVYLVDPARDWEKIKGEDGKAKTLLFSLDDYNEKRKTWKRIGNVD